MFNFKEKRGGSISTELPLRLLVISEFISKEIDYPLGGLQPTPVTIDTLDSVLSDFQVSLDFWIGNVNDNQGEDETRFNLKINKIEDFRPQYIALQAPYIRNKLDQRKLIQFLQAQCFSSDMFQDVFSKIIHDDDSLKKLTLEISHIYGTEKDDAINTAHPPPNLEIIQRLFQCLDLTLNNLSTPLTAHDISSNDLNKESLFILALREFLHIYSLQDWPVEIDENLFDHILRSHYDIKINEGLDQILHHPEFQKIEASWRSLALLLNHIDPRDNVIIEIANISKKELTKSFFEANELIQSPLYKTLKDNAYDLPGQIPYAAIISNYLFDNSAPDMALLDDLSKVASAAACPFLGSVNVNFFFDRDSTLEMRDLRQIPDHGAHMATTDYIKWNSLRASEDSRFLGLILPRFLLRPPYEDEVCGFQSFHYTEEVDLEDYSLFLWGNPGFLYAIILIRSFQETSLTYPRIKGSSYCGVIDNLSFYKHNNANGSSTEVILETSIHSTKERELSELGFIPLCPYLYSASVCFYSDRSILRPEEFDDVRETELSRLKAHLAPTFLLSRISHLVRIYLHQLTDFEEDLEAIEEELNLWLKNVLQKMAASYLGEDSVDDSTMIAKVSLDKTQKAIESSFAGKSFARPPRPRALYSIQVQIHTDVFE